MNAMTGVEGGMEAACEYLAPTHDGGDVPIQILQSSPALGPWRRPSLPALPPGTAPFLPFPSPPGLPEMRSMV